MARSGGIHGAAAAVAAVHNHEVATLPTVHARDGARGAAVLVPLRRRDRQTAAAGPDDHVQPRNQTDEAEEEEVVVEHSNCVSPEEDVTDY